MNSDLRERPKDTYSVIWNAVWNAAGLDDGECESITQAVLTAMGDIITRQELDEAVAAEREACANVMGDVTKPTLPPFNLSDRECDAFDAGQEAAIKAFIRKVRARSEQKEGE